MTRAISILSILCLAGTANGAIYTGNPVLSFRVDRPQHDLVSGSVGLTTVRMDHCGGGYTDHGVTETVDPTDVVSFAISPGDYCGVTLIWSSAMTLSGTNFVLENDVSTTYVALETSQANVILSSSQVVSGTPQSGTPRLYVQID